MAKTKQAESAVPYLERLLGDEYVQEQLRTAASGLLAVYRRGSRKGGKAAEDKKVYAGLRQATTSIRNAATAIKRPQPQPRRRGRRVMAVAALAGGATLLLVMRRGREQAQSQASGAGSSAQTGGSH